MSNSVHEASNAQKSKVKDLWMTELTQFFATLVKDNLLTDIQADYEEELACCGSKIKADYLLTDFRGSKILCFTQTSIRERWKGQFYRALLLRKYSKYKDEFIGVYFVYDDKLATDNEFVKLQTKVERDNQRFEKVLAVDGVFTCHSFKTYLETLSAQATLMLASSSVPSESCSGTMSAEKGASLSNRGHLIETEIARALNDPQTLSDYQNNVPVVTPTLPELAPCITDLLNVVFDVTQLNPQSVKAISATTNIPLKGTRGYRKTDVSIKVDGKMVNVSCKISNQKSVSCHESNAQAFINHLYPTPSAQTAGAIMIDFLNDFQAAGNWKSFKAWPDTKKALWEKEYDAQRRSICEFALQGVDHSLAIPDPYEVDVMLMLSGDMEKKGVFPISTYIDRLLQDAALNDNQLGAPFSWTYPSKKRGSKIQLKTKLHFAP